MGLRMPSTGQQEVLLRSLILALICAVAFSTRLFSVLRYESIIHEFDPWFNFRATRYAELPATPSRARLALAWVLLGCSLRWLPALASRVLCGSALCGVGLGGF